MIIKGQARGRARQLAAHLLKRDENERIRLYECRRTLAQDIEGALIEMEARGMAARTQKPLYHASISPEVATPLNDTQIRQAVDLLEEKLGLHGLPRIVVLHRKKEREHVHVVWCRIDAETGTAVHLSWNYRLHEQASRELERAFGHRPIESSFTVAGKPRPTRRSAKDYEQRQAKRSGRAVDAVTAELTAIWNGADDAATFRRELTKAGYTLARGDLRVFVVIDRAGQVHSLARRIEGADTAAIRKKMQGVSINDLPSVAEARPAMAPPSSRGSVSCRFAPAAGEVSRRTAEDRTPLHRTVRQSAVNLRAMVTPPIMAVVPKAGWMGRPGLILRDTAQPHSNYRSQRAALVAEYASKIAIALRRLPPNEIDSAISKLLSEREAALEHLKLSNRTTTRRKGGRRRANRSPFIVPRFRPRKLRKP